MAVTLLGDGGWSTSTLGCDGFIVAKVAIAQTAIRCPQRRTTNSVANHEPEGPDFSRAKNSRHEAAPLCPEHRRRAGAKAQPKRPIYCSFRGEPRTGRARLQSGQKQPSRSAPHSALSIVEGSERRRSRSDRSIALLLWLLVFHLRLKERNQTLAPTHPQNTSKLTCQGPQFTSKTSNQHKMNHLIKKINLPKLAF